MTRSELFDALSKLLPGQLAAVIFKVQAPRENLPGEAASPAERVTALLIWAEQGGKLAEVEQAYQSVRRTALVVKGGGAAVLGVGVAVAILVGPRLFGRGDKPPHPDSGPPPDAPPPPAPVAVVVNHSRLPIPILTRDGKNTLPPCERVTDALVKNEIGSRKVAHTFAADKDNLVWGLPDSDEELSITTGGEAPRFSKLAASPGDKLRFAPCQGQPPGLVLSGPGGVWQSEKSPGVGDLVFELCAPAPASSQKVVAALREAAPVQLDVGSYSLASPPTVVARGLWIAYDAAAPAAKLTPAKNKLFCVRRRDGKCHLEDPVETPHIPTDTAGTTRWTLECPL